MEVINGIKVFGDCGLPSEYELKDQSQILWVAGWYEPGGYDGDGEALVAYKDGTFEWKGLGHCSCYGPWDGVKEKGAQDAEYLRLLRTSDPKVVSRGYGEGHTKLLKILDEVEMAGLIPHVEHLQQPS